MSAGPRHGPSDGREDLAHDERRGPPLPGRFPAFVVHRAETVYSAVEDLELADLPAGDVLIAVEWSGINFKDSMVLDPAARVARTSPLVPGVDLAGTVVASAVSALPVGTPVLAQSPEIGVARHGGFAGYARVEAGSVVVLPAGLCARDAMVIGTAGFTSALSLDALERHGLRPGDGPVVVTGATGGVGSFAVAILAARGYEVVASTGKTAAAAWLTGLGASRVVSRSGLFEEPERILGPQRWAGAIDAVGGSTLAAVLRSLRYGAAVAASGLTGGNRLETTMYPFIVRGASLLGIDSTALGAPRRAELWARLAGDLRPADLERFVEEETTLEGLRSALTRIAAGGVRGRVLVRPTR